MPVALVDGGKIGRSQADLQGFLQVRYLGASFLVCDSGDVLVIEMAKKHEEAKDVSMSTSSR